VESRRELIALYAGRGFAGSHLRSKVRNEEMNQWMVGQEPYHRSLMFAIESARSISGRLERRPYVVVSRPAPRPRERRPRRRRVASSRCRARAPNKPHPEPPGDVAAAPRWGVA
jgi:hypothetical protein